MANLAVPISDPPRSPQLTSAFHPNLPRPSSTHCEHSASPRHSQSMVAFHERLAGGRGRALGCALIVLVAVSAAGVWLNFALGYERERVVSPDGEWVATAYINGTPLSAENERVHVWRWWQPHFRWLGCQVLEAKNESPTQLRWEGATQLRVQHGFRSPELIGFKSRCGPVRVSVERKFAPYS
jgi:hypothetical protein